MSEGADAMRHFFASFEQHDNNKPASVIAGKVVSVYVDDEDRTCVRMENGDCYRVREGHASAIGRIEAVLEA